jgi:hypothetical protein
VFTPFLVCARIMPDQTSGVCEGRHSQVGF